MRNPSVISAMAALVLMVAVPASAAGHGNGEGGISCEPEEVTAGGTVVLAGEGLEAETERVINLVGPDLVVPFGTVTTDAEGMFSLTLTVPGHLPSGTYRFEAIGDETLTTDLLVTAVPGQAQEPKNEAEAVVTPRARSGVEIALIGAFVLVSLILGLLLVTKAEWFGRVPEVTERTGEF